MSLAIQVENLSKAYQLGQFGTGTISRDLERWWALTRGKQDPFLKIGESNDRLKKSDSDIVWSLKDLDFKIEQGQTVGIIGKNGAGKSTLLKVLSQVTTPTIGKIKMKGRVASLLEVGTGFHPELTGRENIYLNGAILGMRKSEIKRKFDEIVDFSGVERYIETPVKRYSSGMYVRLAFAVAAHLESEILIVDEVLAVGDAEFQKKCIGKMGDISKGEGKTVLFVSHNMQSVVSLCTRGIMLKNGALQLDGNVKDVVDSYLNTGYSINKENLKAHRIASGGIIDIEDVTMSTLTGVVPYNEDISLNVSLASKSVENHSNLYFYFKILNVNEEVVLVSCSEMPFSLEAKQARRFEVILNKRQELMPGKYKVMLALVDGHILNDTYSTYDIINGYPFFEIVPSSNLGGFDNVHRWNQSWGSLMTNHILKEIPNETGY
jgi:lipopolysaccharide transport system ATP-binding protein